MWAKRTNPKSIWVGLAGDGLLSVARLLAIDEIEKCDGGWRMMDDDDARSNRFMAAGHYISCC